MPEGAVYVGRPTRWGNPWNVGSIATRGGEFVFMTADDAVGRFRKNQFDLMRAARRELRGKDLACWCPLDQPCHADVLLEWANS